jgi:hypothetical protein
MAIDIEDRAQADEVYERAANSSDLRCDPDQRGSLDVIIAAGWSDASIGKALLRLHSEFCTVADRRKPIPLPTITEYAAKLPQVAIRIEGARTIRGPDIHRAALMVARAKAEAERSRISELRLKAVTLKSRAVVWQYMMPWAKASDISEEAIAEALLHWLTGVCPSCEGRQYRLIPGTPKLDARLCEKCSGIGWTALENAPPRTRMVLDHIQDCLSAARQSLRKNLSNYRKAKGE